MPDAGASTAATRRLLREVRILRTLLPLVDLAAAPSGGGAGKGLDLYLVTPLAVGGDLWGLLAEVAAGQRLPLPDATLRRLMALLLAALASLHSAGIVHRDAKPGNVFLTGGGGDGVGDVLLGDFGLSRHINPHRSLGGRSGRGEGSGSRWPRPAAPPAAVAATATASVASADDAGLTQGVATRGYRAPELRASRSRTAYDAGIDVWAAGVVLAEVLLPRSRLPAGAAKPPRGRRAAFDAPAWVAEEALAGGAVLPPDAVDLLGRLLAANPATRITAAEATAHPYLAPAAPPSVALYGRDVCGGPAVYAPLEPPAGAGKAELGRLLWNEVTAFHPELEHERPLLGGGAEGGKGGKRRRWGALLRRR